MSERSILSKFPWSPSQHRPSLITTPPLISLTNLAPIPRWNFRKTDRKKFTEQLETYVEEHPTPSKKSLNQDYKRFTHAVKRSAKESIPRGYLKSYAPTRDSECDNLFQQYKKVENPDDIKTAASNLIDKLMWNVKVDGKEAVAEVDFMYSSHKPWLNINRLTGRNTTKKHCPVPPNVIAKQVVSNGIYHRADKSFQREIKRNVTPLTWRRSPEPGLLH